MAELEDEDDRDSVDIRWWRQRQRAMGMVSRRQSRQAPVTGLLIAFTVLVFVFIQHGLTGVSPASLAMQGGVLAPPYARPSQWLTAIFLHASITHIGLNMLSLWIVGSAVEPEGTWWQFLLLYLGTGIAGNVVAAYTQPVSVVGAGASGAIFGLVGAIWAISRRKTGVFRQRLRHWVIGVVLLNLLFDVTVPGISLAAHAGGFLAGLGLTPLLGFGRDQSRW